jgi:mono/diheme cytochrome c family protein
MTTSKRKGIWIGGAVVVVLALALGLILYDRLRREQPQPAWIVQTGSGAPFGDIQFKYLSIDVERDAGLPYWIFYVLPMIFPEKLPAIGGYEAFGLPWEEGVELPIGMTKVTIGYPRIGFNCALCHTTRYRKQPTDKPTFIPAGPGHTQNIEALSRFFYECAKDPRFDSANILSAMDNFVKLDLIDWLLYRFYIIPETKKRIIEGGENFLWTYRTEPPAWGRGQDGPTYSRKYVRDDVSNTGHYGSNQFPAIWNLAKYQDEHSTDEPQRLNSIGDGRDVRSVVVASLQGLLRPEPRDTANIEKATALLTAYLQQKAAPHLQAFDPADSIQSRGKDVFDRECASCHAPGSARLGKPMPLAEVKTDPDYANRWAAVSGGQPAYVVPHLDGIWLRAPYLHNGSVPTLWDLLQPAQQRPVRFYRGYDVLDLKNVGFVSAETNDDAKHHGALFDTTTAGNSNQGHEYGVGLSDDEKWALIAFMKSL